MSEFNWQKIYTEIWLSNHPKDVEATLEAIGEEVQRQSNLLEATWSATQRVSGYTHKAVDALEARVERLRYYALASTALEALILAYLLWGLS